VKKAVMLFEGRRFQTFEKMMLRRIFGLKREKSERDGENY